MSDLVDQLLHPRTDAGVLAQVVGIVVVWALVAYTVRSDRNLVHFVTGLALLALAWRGLRAVH